MQAEHTGIKIMELASVPHRSHTGLSVAVFFPSQRRCFFLALGALGTRA